MLLVKLKKDKNYLDNFVIDLYNAEARELSG